MGGDSLERYCQLLAGTKLGKCLSASQETTSAGDGGG